MAKLTVPVSPDDHVQGPDNAEVTLVEYGDYECHDCGLAYSIVKQVQKHFGTRLRFVFRTFPLTKVHPHAESAAETAEFAGAHGKFWEMHDLLFESQDRLGDAVFSALAGKLELSPAELNQALEGGKFAARVRAEFSGGVRSGVNRTPTFFLNGDRYEGPVEFTDLVSAIDKAIAGENSSA